LGRDPEFQNPVEPDRAGCGLGKPHVQVRLFEPVARI
jgi:hypothetical protein